MAPSFYKIILSSKKVRIPKAFVSQTKGCLATGTVVLRDKYRNFWRVEFSRNGQKFYFGNGWNRCFSGSRLKTGDLVTFEYTGGNLFKFKVYGRNGCWKKGAGVGNMPDQEPRDYNLEEDQEEELENEEVESSDESDFDYVMAEEDTDDDDDDDDVDGNDYAEEEEEDEVNMYSRDKATPSNKQSKNSKESSTYAVRGSVYFRSQNQKKVYGDDIFNSIPDCRPKIPYFVLRSKPQGRNNKMLIPKTVIKDHKLDIPQRIFLVDEQSREWKTKVHNYDSEVCCSGGLNSLCNANNITTNDICICEFVQKEGSNTVSCIRVRPLVVVID